MRSGRRLVLVLGLAAAAIALVVWRRERPLPAAPPAEVTPPVAVGLPVVPPDAATPPTPAAPAPPAPAPPAPTLAAPAPKRPTPARPQPPADPFVDALTATTPEGARLNADYARARIPAPAEARALIDMRRRGLPQDQLVAYVRTSFPKGILVRAIALRWLGVGATAGQALHGATDPGSTLAPSAAP